jgi:AcrR family transcriptional regulator
MARKYEMKRRAEAQEQMRQRIVEAAIELHETVGPASTSVSAIAKRAGVQRHTYYRHFPDERSLMMACSGLYAERNPLPDPESWRAIADPVERLAHGLDMLYRFFGANERMLSSVMRDAEVDPLLREINAIRFGPGVGAIFGVLAEGFPRDRRHAALLNLVLQFTTWRSLVRDSGLEHDQAVETMVDAFRSATGAPRTRRRRRSPAPPRATARSAPPGG